jgi:hypothetical protein
MTISDLIRFILKTPDCRVNAISGVPSIQKDHMLPNDLSEFYQLCGGITLFEHAAYPFYIVEAKNLLVANPIILKGITQEELDLSKNDISWSWYIIANDGTTSQYITIDLSPERLGRCYDSFWEIHPGNSPIIATSFTELVENLLDNKGQSLYWL